MTATAKKTQFTISPPIKMDEMMRLLEASDLNWHPLTHWSIPANRTLTVGYLIRPAKRSGAAGIQALVVDLDDVGADLQVEIRKGQAGSPDVLALLKAVVVLTGRRLAEVGGPMVIAPVT